MLLIFRLFQGLIKETVDSFSQIRFRRWLIVKYKKNNLI